LIGISASRAMTLYPPAGGINEAVGTFRLSTIYHRVKTRRYKQEIRQLAEV
jgi:hypothetical protein